MATTTERADRDRSAVTSRPQSQASGTNPELSHDSDPQETAEWLESLEYVLETAGADRVRYLLKELEQKAYREGVTLPFSAQTPYINTIPFSRQPEYPGDREIERRIKNILRWNAMAMVVQANKKSDGIGGHISTFASSASLYEVAQNHFFRGDDHGPGDLVYFQGHASPGMYARAFLEGRLTEQNLSNFRRELGEGGGLSSYPHPWLMPTFWQFPTVSMGLGPITSIYQARFARYLQHRGLCDTSPTRVWAFLGDGECDEPETLGSITLASREKLDNLTWVINCNLQRLDGPVRGNGKIIQELEGLFRGAGWNVIKCIWGSDWDPLLAKDVTGKLVNRLGEVVDGQFQKYVVSDGGFIRDDLFGATDETAKIVEDLSDEQIRRLSRGGHDPLKVYAAYHAAVNHKGAPTVVLAQTVKGYGLGESAEGQNTAHNTKKLAEDALKLFRDRCEIPLSDEEAAKAKFYKPADDSPEMKYLMARRKVLGGFVPRRSNKAEALPELDRKRFERFLKGSGERAASTTMGFVQVLTDLLRDKTVGDLIVPIVPDESRTFGMEGLFSTVGIYAPKGQLYEPVDAKFQMYYKEATDGQILEEGITEAGSMSSFIAAGTAHNSFGVNTIPFFVYYSMFGFQRIGDLIWLAADMRCRGFLIGGTAGRTTLNGEGLQHEDGHSHLIALSVPNLLAYDPAYAYETAVIVLDGIKRMYTNQEDIFYYITVHNENYVMPPMPEGEGVEEGILKGMYRYKAVDAGKGSPKVNLFGSGAILNEVLKAQDILAEKYGVSSQVWSVTSYKRLSNEAEECRRWNLTHPTEAPKKSYVEQILAEDQDACLSVSSSDNVRALGLTIAPFMPTPYYVLGTDGFGRSETRENLRRFFEVDAQCVTLATLTELAKLGKIDSGVPAQAIQDLGIDPEKTHPFRM